MSATSIINQQLPSTYKLGLYHWTYYLYGYWIEIQDPRTIDYPLVNVQPYTIGLIMFGYYYVMSRLGPRLMKNREPIECRKIMFLYNILMVMINFYFFHESLIYSNFLNVFLNFDYPRRDDYSPGTMKSILIGWWYWMTKFVDWFDTLFYVLRKKHDHISFLHLYHHISVPIFGYLLLKINCKIPAAHLFILINSMVHTAMYSYYALAALGPAVRRYLWWKRYITVLQLAQFGIGTMYGLMIWYYQNGYPPVWLLVGLAQPPFFFWMFYKFYQQAYRQQHQKWQNKVHIHGKLASD